MAQCQLARELEAPGFSPGRFTQKIFTGGITTLYGGSRPASSGIPRPTPDEIEAARRNVVAKTIALEQAKQHLERLEAVS